MEERGKDEGGWRREGGGGRVEEGGRIGRMEEREGRGEREG